MYLADLFPGAIKPLNFAVQSGARRGNIVGRYRYDYQRPGALEYGRNASWGYLGDT